MAPDTWPEVEKLYHAALEREPSERTAFLDSVCADERLRREVESLLGYQDLGDSLFEHRPWRPVPALKIGARIGSYRIDAPIGEGGMGVVYRALDVRLNRPVAVKVLPDELAGAAARRRFQREAQMASSLNHPHILTVHDVGEFENRQYLITEYVDGGTLRDWARAGSRTWRECVELLTGVAEGLAAAHEAGILHRDIKPENILVPKSGYAKLADFGLAQLVEATERDRTRTLTGQRTAPGVVIGTVAYMSPEQASGKPLDVRSDIFSFGLVLYELVSGHRAFEGSTSLEVLQKIMRGAPQPVPQHLPVALRKVIEKALGKEPADRYQSTRDLLLDLRKLVHESENAAPARPRFKSAWKWSAAIAFVLLALLGAVLFLNSRSSPSHGALEYTQITDYADSARAPALSPDGRMVTFIRGGQFFQSRGQIYVKLLPDGEAKQLTNEPDLKYAPVFTPDGSRIAYTLLKPGGSWDTWTVPVLGGQSTLLLPNASGLTWLSNKQVLFSEIKKGTGTHMGIVTSAEDRSDERPIYFPAHRRGMAHYSFASPDRNWILIVEMDHTTSWLPCRLVSLASSKNRQVGPKGACLAAGWSPDGHWMYFNAEVAGAWHLWRQHFPDGTPQQITFGPSEEEGVALAPDGRSLVTSVGVRSSTIWIHDAGGDRPISSEAFAFAPQISADGMRVFYLSRQNPASVTSQSPARDRSSPFGQSGALWSIDLASGKTERLLPGFTIFDFALSNDEKEIVFAAEGTQIWLAPLDRRSPPRLLARGALGPSFGGPHELIFIAPEEKQNVLYRINTDGTGREQITTTPVLAKWGTSPDGQWVTALVPAAGEETNWKTVAFRIHGGEARTICPFFCLSQWSADGKYLYLDTDIANSSTGRTFAIPLQHGRQFPDFPVSGIASPADLPKVPGVKVIERSNLSVGPDPSTYAYSKHDFQGNLFRIAFH
ncbi:MAG TPA: protein kinase [Bryobacteraceae bacterium]|nr:protein kinase [Bryobacteraceae bacterium]